MKKTILIFLTNFLYACTAFRPTTDVSVGTGGVANVINHSGIPNSMFYSVGSALLLVVIFFVPSPIDWFKKNLLLGIPLVVVYFLLSGFLGYLL